MRRLALLASLAALAAGGLLLPRHLESRAAVAQDFVHFESAHVRPAVLTPNGERLLVVNTPDNRLSVFDVRGGLPVRVAEIPVGLEPVSVAARSDHEAWVVNHLSDDVSIVDLDTGNVRATLRVGDEPTDVVFAGTPLAAFVCVSQEDGIVTVDPGTLAATDTIPIAGRMPRALARSGDGTRVYVTVLHAGNRTSVLSQAEAQDSLPPPSPPMSPTLPAAPAVGLIVKQQNGDWRDDSGKLWNSKIKYSIYDTDLAEIDAASHVVTRRFGDLATVNYGVAVNPQPGGAVAVTGTEARNLVRFEPNLRGHLVDTRLGVITQAGTRTIRNLNPHVNYSVTPGPAGEADSSIGIPNGVAWSGDGQRIYVTSLASNRLAVLTGTGTPSLLTRAVTVAGPTGVVVDDARGKLYVVGRFRNQLEVLSTASLASLAVVPIGFDPTPNALVNGRKFFYGGFTSGHGDQACATCHVFGDFDALAWDLGDPTGTLQPKPPGMIDPLIGPFHPMKGPMTTQTLRGLPGTGILHWRGDRANLAAFNGAFVSLLGRSTALPDSELTAFDDFVMPLVNPPNPNQRLDRGMVAPTTGPSAARGQTFFFNTPVDGGGRCNDCHTATNFGTGTNGQMIDRFALQESQDMKVPQLRNLYRKTGFVDLPGETVKRGFGFVHDGSIDNLFNFLRLPVFNFGSSQSIADANRRDVEAFLLSFDTGMPPAVGAQVTFNGANNGDGSLLGRLDTLRGQAEGGTNYADLIAKGRVAGQPRGWVYVGGGSWQPDRSAQPNVSTAQLLALAGPGTEITFTGVPEGSGLRMGIDRDRDTWPDGDELAAGSDPGDPTSTPQTLGVPVAGNGFRLESLRPNPFRGALQVSFTLGRAGKVDLEIYDVLGREVKSVARGLTLVAGPQSLRWDGSGREGHAAASGVYFVRLRTEGGTWTRPVVRIE